MLIFVSGHYPIYGTQILYFMDPTLSKRAELPPPRDFPAIEDGHVVRQRERGAQRLTGVGVEPVRIEQAQGHARGHLQERDLPRHGKEGMPAKASDVVPGGLLEVLDSDLRHGVTPETSTRS